VYPVGVPVVFLYLLWRDEQQRVPGAEQTVSVAADSSFHFLRADYKSKYYFYECVILLEKMLLTGLLAFVDQGSTFQAFVGGTLTNSFPRISWIRWLVLTEMHRRIRLHCLCILRDPGQNVAIRQDY